MYRKFYSAILVIAALFIFAKNSESQQVQFGLYYNSPHLLISAGPRYGHPHPYYFPGYIYHRQHYDSYYYPQRRFYREKIYRRHDYDRHFYRRDIRRDGRRHGRRNR